MRAGRWTQCFTFPRADSESSVDRRNREPGGEPSGAGAWRSGPDGVAIRDILVVMGIRSDRRFDFDHSCAEVWAALARVEQYPLWWPWLECDGVALAEGESWRCRVDPPLPYSLDFELHVREVTNGRFVRADLTGDLVGEARLTLTGSDDERRSVVRLESSLEAATGPVRLVARFLRPIATFGHDWVLDTGARRFRSIALGDDQGRSTS